MAARWSTPATEKRLSDADTTLSATVMARRPPAPRRSAGTKAMPRRMEASASAGAFAPSIATRPSRGQRPNSASPRPSLPEFGSPPTPRISPARTSKLRPSSPGAAGRSPTGPRIGIPNAQLDSTRHGGTSPKSRPTIEWIRRSSDRSSLSSVSIVRPSRMMVTRSARSSTSRRW